MSEHVMVMSASKLDKQDASLAAAQIELHSTSVVDKDVIVCRLDD